MKKIASLLMMAGILAMGSASVQSAPEPEKDGLVTICYYGVTMKVSQKIANRYYKIGAQPGACGEETPQPI